MIADLLDYVANEFSGLEASSNGGTVDDHKRALIEMGLLQAEEKKQAPFLAQYLFELFKEIRFSATNENKLMPRANLAFLDLNEWQKMSGFQLSFTECGIILSIDAIYNKSG